MKNTINQMADTIGSPEVIIYQKRNQEIILMIQEVIQLAIIMEL